MAIRDESISTPVSVALKCRHTQAKKSSLPILEIPALLQIQKTLCNTLQPIHKKISQDFSTPRIDGKMVHWFVFRVAANNRHGITPRTASYKHFLSRPKNPVTKCHRVKILGAQKKEPRAP
ncbi:hypothetical protein ACOSQ3_030845 [Xanthoceras sorbifolium]